MKHLLLAASVLTAFASPAFAAEPMGEWLVADKSARIQIEKCPTGLWGFVSWLKEPAVDDQNPDKSKRNRQMIGIPILLGMKEAKKPGRWDGEVYNAKDGRTYEAHIALEDANTLRIEGCVLGGIICSGESWTRVATQSPPAASGPQKRPATTANRVTPAPMPHDACSGVSETGTPKRL